MSDPRMTFASGGEGRPLRVPRGVFVLRYVASSGGLGAPEVAVAAPPGSDVEIIAADQAGGESVLGMPGDAVVLRASRDSAVLVTIVPQVSGGSRDAHVTLERVSSSKRPQLLARAAGAPIAIEGAASLEILAHVSRRGDIVVRGEEWICGPQFPMAIEGLELRWPGLAAGVDIMTSAVINARGRKTLPPAPSGTFVGTRGKAAPLVGVTFTLTGPKAANYRLVCEALFLGAPVTSRAGSVVELMGPTGHEPLVGLRLSVEPTVRSAAQPFDSRLPALERPRSATSPGSENQAPLRTNGAGSASRVRVFRTSRSRTQLTHS